MVAFDDFNSVHIGLHNPIPAGFGNVGAIAIGY